jgi:hypothetical protein
VGVNLVTGSNSMIPLCCVGSYLIVHDGEHRYTAWRMSVSLSGLACKLRLSGGAEGRFPHDGSGAVIDTLLL